MKKMKQGRPISSCPMTLIFAGGRLEWFTGIRPLQRRLHGDIVRCFRVGRFSINYMRDEDLAIAEMYEAGKCEMVKAAEEAPQYRDIWRADRLRMIGELAQDLEALADLEGLKHPHFVNLRADMAAEVIAWN